MNKNKFLVFLFLAGLAFLAFAKTSYAAIRCETQYGGGEICVTTGQLQINKKIFDPDRSDWVDNLYVTDHKFKTSDFVKFKLIIKNVGDNTLYEIKVIDNLPDFLFFSGGSTSEYTIDQLNPGESTELEVLTQVVSESQLKVNQDCDVNTAEATSKEGFHDKDTAKLCVTKQVLGVTTLPKTGPSDTFLILSLSTLAGLVGIALVKFSKKIA